MTRETYETLPPLPPARPLPPSLSPSLPLCMQNKGGGHGEIGFHMAKQLLAKGLDVHLLQVNPSAKTVTRNPKPETLSP